MKIIFLDIDGVLVNHATVCKRVDFDGCRFNPFDPACVAQLNRIIEATDAEIVVSSSWRCDGPRWDSLLFFFTDQGILKRPIDRTPDLPVLFKGGEIDRPQRGDEILKWLVDNAGWEKFVAIDDDSDMDAIKDNFVLVKLGMEKGLEAHHADAAIAILTKP